MPQSSRQGQGSGAWRQSSVSHSPDEMKSPEQMVRAGPARISDDAEVQVESDSHRPEEGTGVGESRERALQHAVPRRSRKVLQHPVEVRGSREQVR